MMPEPSSDCCPIAVFELHDARHHLGRDLLDGSDGQAGRRHARRSARGRRDGGLRRSGIRLDRQRDSAADAGGHDGDSHRAGNETACVGTLLRAERDGRRLWDGIGVWG